MKKNTKVVQLTLISIGLLLILSTYFFYPKIKENMSKKKTIQKEMVKTDDEIEGNIFENLEYEGIYDGDKQFKITSEKAYILTSDPDIVYMTKMKITLYMNDGRIVVVTSDKGKYNKVTYDSYFIGNVKATDGKTVILSENLNLLATEDFASIFNNVVLTTDEGSLRADQIDYDFMTRHYHVSMFGNEKVRIKLVEWIILKNLGL